MWRIVGVRPSRSRARESADSEHDLLLDPHLVVAAVEPGGDLAVGGSFSGQVRVEQQERHAPHLRHARAGRHRRGPRGPPRRSGRLPSGGSGDRERQIVRLEQRVRLVSAALDVDDLAEVALSVEEARRRRAGRRGRSRTSGGRPRARRGRPRRSGGPRSGRTPPRSRRSARPARPARGPPGSAARPGPPRSAGGSSTAGSAW